MKFSIKDFFSKCDQIRSFLRIWSHLLKKSLNRKLHVFGNYVHSSLSAFAMQKLTKFPEAATRGVL